MSLKLKHYYCIENLIKKKEKKKTQFTVLSVDIVYVDAFDLDQINIVYNKF